MCAYVFGWPINQIRFYTILTLVYKPLLLDCACNWLFLLFIDFFLFSSPASAQNIQIQAQPQTVVFLKNDLVIVCSINNPTQLSSVFFIQILKNSSTTFDNVVSVTTWQALPVTGHRLTKPSLCYWENRLSTNCTTEIDDR